MKKAFFILLLALVSGATSLAQLTGIKTVPGDYATIAAAISALNASGAGTGGVTFNIAAGHTETFTSPASGRITTLSGSQADPIIFQKSGTGENPAITAAAGSGGTDGIVVICGGDNITIDGLKLIENGANTNQTTQMEWGIAVLKASVTDGSQHVTIKNCTISLDKTNTNSKGIYSNNHTATDQTQLAITALSGTNSYLKIYSNTISNCYTDIYLFGYVAPAPYTFYDQGCEIGVSGANFITNIGGGDITAYGIYTKYQNNIKVANNNITSSMSGTATVYGIYMTSASNASYDLYGNYVSIQYGGTDGYNANLYGIYCDMGASGTSNISNIYNNTVTACSYPEVISAQIYCMYLLNMGVTSNVYGNLISNNTFGSLSVTGSGLIRYMWCQKASSVTGQLEVHNNTVSGNTRLSSDSGSGLTYYLAVSGSGTILNCYNNLIDNNIVGNRGGAQCLYISFNDDIYKNIYNNTITNISQANSSTVGIYNGNGTLGRIYNNTIQNISSSATGTINITGINHSSGAAMYYYNNMISDLVNPRSESIQGYDYNTLNGIYVEPGAEGSIKGFYYNTVYLNSSTSATTFGSSAFCAYSLYGVDLRNNIFINTSASAGTNGKTVGIRARSAGFTGFSSNYNCIYTGIPGSSSLIFTNGTASAQTLLEYKTLVTPQELQSVTEMPPFINIATQPYNIHLQSNTATQCEAGAISVSNPVLITTDIDNNARFPNAGYPVNPSFTPNAPDIGADEIGGLPNDITAPAIVYTPLGNTAGTGNRTLIARITDGTGVPTSGTGLPRLYWKKNSGAYAGVTATSLGGNNYMFTFGSGVSLGDVISYYVVAQDTKSPIPNVGAFPWVGASGFTYSPPACSTPPANPYTYTIVQSISGTFHVGVGKTYTTLTAAANDLNTRGMTGPVIFILDDNAYNNETCPITFLPNSGSSSTNTLTIKPNTGATPVFSASVNANPLILFKGLDYVIMDGSNSGGSDKSLSFENTSATSNSYTLGITNNNGIDGSTHITLKNCIFMASNSNILAETFVIIFNQNGGLNGGRYDNCILENNEIKKAKYAIKVQATASNRNNKLQILNNTIGSANPAEYLTRWGIDIEQSDSTLISGNDIMGPALGSTAPAQFGIIIWNNNTNTRILKNRIHDWISQDMSSIGIKYSDDNSTTPTEISNNVIYNIGCYGMNPGPSQNNPYGIFIRNGGNLNIWNNSIYLSGGYLAGNDTYGPSSSCIGIYNYVTGPLDIRNNILRNSMTNPIPNPGEDDWGKAYGIQLSVSPAVFSNLDNNDYYIDGFHAQIAQYFDQSTGITDFPTLASWQAYTGREANSINADPLYIGTSDLKLQAGSPAIGMATPIAQVTTDFEGTPRHATYPTIGAYEYAPPLNLTWTGLMNTSWNTAGNWSPIAVPKFFTDVVIPASPEGGAVFPVVPAAGGPFSAKGLQVNPAAMLILQAGSTLNITNN